MRALLDGLRRIDLALYGVRNRLTPGQRWTAALALGLAAVVALFGAPKSA